MHYNKLVDMIEQCKALLKEELCIAGDLVSVRLPDGAMFIADPSKKVDNVEDIVKIKAGDKVEGLALVHRSIYQARPDVNAIITNHSPYCLGVSKTEKFVPAALDDMAQIIGKKAVIAQENTVECILKSLKKSGACIIKNAGVIATGRTLDEAHTGSLVLEKGSKVFVEASILGGAKLIGTLDAALMRFVYKKKYSKLDQSAKMEELQS